MFSDEPTSVAMVMGTADTLANMLRGIGFPKVTAQASTIDGKRLSDSLGALRDQIDAFLKAS